ncbi:MAG: thioredoxin family protein [Pseudomonadota bacterium]
MSAINAVDRQTWLAARKELLAEEKAFTRAQDAMHAKVRALPWVKVDNAYAFDTEDGPKTLSDLFDGASQLMTYHFMFGPTWEEGCPSCSMCADGFDSVRIHLRARDVKLVAVSRCALHKLLPFKARMGWSFDWVSSEPSSFNKDFCVSFDEDDRIEGEVTYNYGRSRFPSDEAPGISVFKKTENGAIYHTYSSYGRGLDRLLLVYRFLDVAPNGRNEDSLEFPMAWVRRHDRYDQSV